MLRSTPKTPGGRGLGPLLAGLALLLAPPSGAEIYRWTDAQGRVHFTQNLNDVPPEHRQEARKSALDGAGPSRLQTFSAPPASAATSSPARRPGDTLRIPFEPYGTLMRVQARLNDRVDAPFLIDTGASGVAIPQWVADRLGLRIGPDTEWIRTRTANGLVARPLVRLDSIELGGARVERLPATINPTMDEGLLGGAFFNNFVYGVDAAAGVITLRRNEGVAGGVSEEQWRSRFGALREGIARIDAYLERLPETHRVRRDELAEHRARLVGELAELESEANRLGVPHAWR